MFLAQGHKEVTPVRLQPAAFQSHVKNSTTKPLCSLGIVRSKPIFCFPLSNTTLLAAKQISVFYFVSVAEQAGLSLI